MKLKIRFADQIVGLFVLLAIGALCAILILLGANQRWFAKDYYYTSRFTSGVNLKPGMPIRLKGFQIGVVDSVMLLEDNNVEIGFHVYDTYHEKIYQNSVLELAVNPLGLGGGLLFHPGNTKTDPIAEGSEIPSLDFPAGVKLLKMGLVERPGGGDAVTQILNSVAPLVNDVNALVLNLTSSLALVNRAMEGDTALPVGAILTDVDGLVAQVNQLLAETSASLAFTLDNMGKLSADLQGLTAEPEELVTKLLNPQGSVATLLDDDNVLFDQIQELLTAINQSVAQLETFAGYLNSTQPQITGILDTGQATLDQGKKVLEGLSNNPLLRRGISQDPEQPTTFQGYRDEDF